MTISILASVETFISTDIALAVVAATGNAKMLPIIRGVASTVAASFSLQASGLIVADLKANLPVANASVGLYANLNTASLNITPTTMVSLVTPYSSPLLVSQLSSLLVSQLIQSIIKTTTITLPKQFNIPVMTALLLPLVGNTVNTVISGSISSHVNEQYDNYTSSNEVNIVGDTSVEDTTNKVQSSISQQSVQQTQQFNVFSSDNHQALKANSTGFLDPNATYPSSEYTGQSETNKLARGVVNGTIVQDKFDNRMIGAKLPDGDAFSEPVPAYNARYPYNWVKETRSGHVIELDDTPGNERIHIYHTSGTYYEIDAVGNVIHRCDGSEFNIIDGNGYTSISGTGNISIGGDLKVMVCGNAHIEVTGDAIINGYNDVEVNAAGRLQLSGGEAIDMRAPNIYIEADNELHINAATYTRIETAALDIKVDGAMAVYAETNLDMNVVGNTTMTTTGALNMNTTGNMIVKTGANLDTTANAIHTNSSGDIDSTAGGNIILNPSGAFSAKGTTVTINSSSALNLTSSGMLNANAGGILALDGTAMTIMSGASSPVTALSTVNAVAPINAITAQEADYSLAGLLDGREDFVNLSIPDTFPSNFADNPSFNSDDVLNVTTSSKIQNDMVKNGLAQPSDFKNPAVADGSDPSAPKSIIPWIEPDTKLLSLTTRPPDNFMLSPHFSLGDVSSKAPAQMNAVVAQNGLTIGQIVYNLSAVALNVLEPIYAVYPTMFVTSGFRWAINSHSPTSAHPYGLAVDMQFKGAAKADYYEIAKNVKGLLSMTDQILLEYKNTGSGNPWLHVGVKSTSGQQRMQVSTMYNNVVYSQGLVQLA